MAEDARFEVVQLQLGVAKIYNGVRTELNGDQSAILMQRVGYYGRHKQRYRFELYC